MSKPIVRKLTSTNYRNETELVAGCPLAAAMKLLGGRWKPILVWYVHHGLDRFSALRSTIPGVSEKMLYQHLRELERDGLLFRNVSGARQVAYGLTELGASLVPILGALASWSERNHIPVRLATGQALGSTG